MRAPGQVSRRWPLVGRPPADAPARPAATRIVAARTRREPGRACTGQRPLSAAERPAEARIAAPCRPIGRAGEIWIGRPPAAAAALAAPSVPGAEWRLGEGRTHWSANGRAHWRGGEERTHHAASRRLHYRAGPDRSEFAAGEE